MGNLYIVATPIGNLKDITLRALEVLEKVDCIACEDTRMTLKLLSHFNLQKHLISHYSHNEKSASKKVLDLLGQGKEVAIVSDSGTPCISDPGTYTVRLAREAGHTIVPIPGPSALAALISVSGFPAKDFTFAGFLSPKKGRRKNELTRLLETESPFVIYESVHRITGLLEDLAELGAERTIVMGREMTKIHEEFFSGKPKEVLTHLTQMSMIKGEFVIFVASRKNSKDLEA